MLLQSLCSLAQSAGGIHHIIHDEAGSPIYIADDAHNLRLVGGWAALINDGQFCMQLLGHCPGPHHAADVWGHYHQVPVVLPLYVIGQHR